MPTDNESPPKQPQYVLMPDLVEAEGVRQPTVERRAYLDGLFSELHEQEGRYISLVERIADFKARMTIVERNLRLTRDHLQMILGQTDDEVPDDWQAVLNRLRFVATRLGDACVTVLKDRDGLTTQEMLYELNKGQFRFRTGSPLREINAALLRQSHVKREDDKWNFTMPKPSRRGRRGVKK